MESLLEEERKWMNPQATIEVARIAAETVAKNAYFTGLSAIIVALITGIITLRITWVNNKRQDDRWRADFFLKIKFEAVNDFITKLNTTIKNLEYFCSEKGHYNMQVTLDLREKTQITYRLKKIINKIM